MFRCNERLNTADNIITILEGIITSDRITQVMELVENVLEELKIFEDHSLVYFPYQISSSDLQEIKSVS
jgi:hypothetical protein